MCCRWCSWPKSTERLPQRASPRRRVPHRGRRRRPGPGPAPISRRPAPTASEATSRARRAASSGSSPRARKAASAEEWVQPEPWAAPSGCRSPGISTSSLAVEEEVDQILAVAAGDDDRLRAQRQHAAGQLLLGRPLPRPGQLARLGDVRRGDRASGSSRSTSAARASSSSSTAPLSATITGSTTTGARRRRGRAPRPPPRPSPASRAFRS